MLSVAAYLLFCVACTVLALGRFPIFGIYFYLAATYVHPPSRWWGSLVPDLRWSLLSAAIAAIAIILHRHRLGEKPAWLTNGPAAIMCAYLLWMVIQTSWAIDQQQHLQGTITLGKYLVAMWLVYRVLNSQENIHDFIFANVLGCALLGIFALTADRSDGRLDGVGGPGIDDANSLAMYFAAGALACASIILSQTGWRRYLGLAAMALILNGLVLANTRGALVALIAGGLVFTFIKAREHARLFWVLAILAIPAAVAIVDEAFIDRMITIVSSVNQDSEMDTSARSRWELRDAQVRMFLDYPMGSGHKGVEVLSPRYLDRQWLSNVPGATEGEAARSSHNTFLTTLSEQGIPGAFMYLMLLIWVIWAIFRSRRLGRLGSAPQLQTLAAGLCGGIVVVMVAGIFTDYLLAEIQYWLLMALVCLFQVSQRTEPVAQTDAGPINADAADSDPQPLAASVEPAPAASAEAPRQGFGTR